MEPGLALLIAFGIFGCAAAQDFYIAAPSIFRLDSDETVAIAINGNNGAVVDVYVQDYPAKAKNISQVVVAMQPGMPKIFTIRLDVNSFPESFLTAPGSPKLVSLNARFLNAHKEIVIPISSQSGYMFIQTDKPIYTPKQSAFFRIISLTEEGLPSSEPFQLQIRNPDDIIVEEKFFNDKNKKVEKAFAGHIYKFPTYPVLGEWSATVRFGHNLEQNSTVRFTLREYVLPTFTVKLKTPDVILPNAQTLSVDVTARHVYGKNVKGVVSFRLGVKSEHAAKPVYFAVISPTELDKGEYTVRIKIDDIKHHKDIGWFPGIDKSHLVVEATVVDFATGNKEEATDSKAIFSNSPFLISFKRCLSDFKPGLTSVFEADITYVDGRPAEGILTKLTAVADNGQQLRLGQNTARSDENGRVSFEIQPELHHKRVLLTLETDDRKFGDNQAKNSFEQFAFVSPNNAYIAISRSSHLKLKPGDAYTTDIHFEPPGLQNIYYLVVARGKILEIEKMKPGAFKNQRLDIKVTHEMVPDFRVVVFTHHGNELLADSLKIEVERECKPGAQVTIQPEFNVKEPGSNGKIIVRGTKDTAVGLLGVDEAVYALSKKDLLTKTKMFDKLSSHDLGCGPGGGLNVNAVLGKAGIALGTNKYTPSHSQSCVEIKRKKREAALKIVRNYSGRFRQCCELGTRPDVYGRTCEVRKLIIEKMDEEYENCSKVFVHCCLNRHKEALVASEENAQQPGGTGRIGGNGFDEVEFIEADLEEVFERETTVRSDFRETWIYENIIVGPDGREELVLSLPHSITTWVVQAVTVSPLHGMCVADPQKLVSFKKLFLHLNLPYSVVRNEQVEIQATVFNYGDTRVGAVVYMYGAKGLCSGTQPGEKSERKRLTVDAQSAASVAFPVIPLNTGHINVKVVVLSTAGSDIIEKQLYVVPEGVTQEIDIPIKLDPTNQQRRKRRHLETPLYSDHIDTTQNLQVTAVKLSAPEGFVPGTASCSISALGDMFGPVVETAINNPEGLLQKPRGCGEQNMMFLAPTLYTMRYLKVSGKLTPASEAKGYEFIRHGYGNQLSFRKNDGSYAAYLHKPTSTWLTAFVMKVFCQATTLVHIDDNVICSGVQWLIQNQEADGSYVEKHPMYHVDMMGGVAGSTPMTAFTLIALEECKCNEESLRLAKMRAVAYLETHLGDVNKPLPVAIVAYALALSDSDTKQVAYDKLQSMAKYDEDNNWMYWTTDNSAQDVETAGYGLLTQLLFNDMGKSNSIVNWLNTKQLQSGSFKSTQDTVVALQALSEYAIRAQLPSINLVSNISSSNDRNFHKVLTFREENALVLQDVKVDKIGGTIFINTAGQGMGTLSVKLRYNVIQPIEDVCKFDVTVNVTDAQNEDGDRNRVDNWEGVINPRGKDMFDQFPEDLIRGMKDALDEEPPALDHDPRRRRPDRVAPFQRMAIGRRVRRQNQDGNSKVKLNIALCVRYLGSEEAGMSIVDVGIFSGFEPVLEDLKKLEKDPTHLIDKFEKSSRGVVLYLEKVPVAEKYCFSFRVIRQYLVGKTQMSVIKVYDYYNPDASCTQFYSPGDNSPLIRTICEGRVCECAEGGCPPKTPFSEIDSLPPNDRRRQLKQILCDNYDYVWLGRLNGRMRQKGGFLNISFSVEEVIKEGIEKASHLMDETRTLLARDNCHTASLLEGVQYLVLGKDGQAYKNENGETWYRYLLDQTSVVFQWSKKAEQSPNKQLQRVLTSVTKNLKEKGCDE